MNCPTDGTVLHLAERHGIEIDYCPTCRGIWLDRGELDKIIERADSPTSVDHRTSHHDRDDDDDDSYKRVPHRDGRRYRRRRGFLGDLFEFGD